MKKFLLSVFAVLMIFSLAACGGENESGGLKKITVCLDWTPNTNHTGLYVALENGYYEEAGLNVSIVQPPENGATLMCASNEAQFAIEGQDTLAPSLTGKSALGVTAVAALIQHNTSGIISRKSDLITSAKGLENKTYSTWDSPVEKAMIKYVMEKEGADFEKLNLIPNVITDEAGALKNGDTDAIWVFYGWGGINAELSGLDFNYFDFKSIDSVLDYYTPFIIANNEFMENEPETVRAFLAATRKGYEFAIENPEEAAQILVNGDTTGSLKDSLEFVTQSQKWISKQYIADAESWGVFDAKRWNGFYEWLWENKLIDEKLDSEKLFTNDFLF